MKVEVKVMDLRATNYAVQVDADSSRTDPEERVHVILQAAARSYVAVLSAADARRMAGALRYAADVADEGPPGTPVPFSDTTS